MKVLIVDDEPHVRETVRMLIPWERHGVTSVLEAGGGEQAAALIETERPEIVFTDMMMPGMDGVALLEWIHAHAERTKVIVISGYDDFRLVRSAMKFGSCDYILKPIDEFELNETFQKAVASWREEAVERNQFSQASIAANQLRPVLADKMFSRLIADPDCIGEMTRTLQDDYGVGPDVKTCRAAIVSLVTLDYHVRKKFESAMELLIYAVVNISSEIMDRHQAGVAFRNWNEPDEVVLLFFRAQDDAIRIAEGVQQALFMALRGQFHVGVGLSCDFPYGAAKAYSEARQTLGNRNLLENGKWLHVFTEYRTATLTCSMSQIEDRLYLALQHGACEPLRAVLDEWGLEVCKLPSISIRQLEWWWQEFNLMLSKWGSGLESAMDRGEEDAYATKIDVSFRLPINVWGEFDLNPWLAVMESALIELAGWLRKQGNGHIVYEVESYIRVHYAEEIHLQALADQFHMSPSHLSRTFKHLLGETISDYIVRLRIGKAKLLLANPNLKLAVVAEGVGYQDEKYFSKAFKRSEGITPKEFRASLK